MAMEVDDIKVSFIVPVYNVENYLAKCLDSIIKQSIEPKEIIIINDGSTDSSLEIARRYEASYNYIKVINKKNQGISVTRNIGIDSAVGEYLCFIDSDDFYKIDQFAEEFYKLCKVNNLDIIRGLYGIYEDEKKKYIDRNKINVSYYYKALRGREFLVKSIKEKANEVVPWLGFFKREYLLKNKIDFPFGIAYEEDQLFFLKALIYDDKCRVMQTDIEFYAYRKRSGSATKTPTLKQAEDVVYVVNNENYIVNNSNLSREEYICAKKYICSSFYQLTSIYGRVGNEDKKDIRNMVPFLMKWECIRYSYNKHQLMKILLFTFAYWLVDLIYDIKLKVGN